jgi:DNA helicase-2/ATP-dependent DNA helicase PcrA
VQNEPSRFIEEMPEEKLDKSSAGGGARNQSSTAGWGSAYDRMHAGRKNIGGTNTSSSSVGSSKPSYLPVNPLLLLTRIIYLLLILLLQTHLYLRLA